MHELIDIVLFGGGGALAKHLLERYRQRRRERAMAIALRALGVSTEDFKAELSRLERMQTRSWLVP